MKHFVTLFPPAENVHLIKDVGQIPYQMHRNFGYKSTVVCYKNSPEYAYLNDEAEGLELHFLEQKGSTFFWEKAPLQYVIKNARSIEVLNLYHLTQASLLYGVVYKLLNPKGILYLKLDFNLQRYREQGIQFSENVWKESVHQWLLNVFLRKADIISAETRESEEIFPKRNSLFNNLMLYVPNGVDQSQLGNSMSTTTDLSEKENIIITVGRIGLPVKNHDVLLKALSKIKLEGWQVYFIGPIQDAFKPVIEKFYDEKPALKEKVHFTGTIVDRSELYSFYRKAKIFCLPSRSEGFPMVLVEALCFGNYIVGTDGITSINEVTKAGNLGHIIPANDPVQLKGALEQVTTKGFYTAALQKNILNHSKKYSWQKIVKALHQRIEKIAEGR